MSKLPFYGNQKAMKGLSLNNPDGWANILRGGGDHKAIDSAWYVANLLKRASAVAAMPFDVFDTNGEKLDEKNLPVKFRGGLKAAFWQASMSLDRYGAAYWRHEQTRGGGGLVKWCEPMTVELDRRPDNSLRSFRRRTNGSGYITYVYDEVAEIARNGRFNRLAWCWSLGLQEVGPGMILESYADLPASLLTASDKLMKNVMESGAVMPHWITADINPKPQEKEKLLARIRRTLFRGTKSGGAIDVFPPSLKASQIGTAPKDLAMENVDAGNMLDVSAVMQTAQMILDPNKGSNRAMLDRVTSNWQLDTVLPHAEHIAESLNQHVFSVYGLTLKHNAQALSVNQEDEKNRALSFAYYVQNGVNPETAAAMLGLTIPEGMELMADLPTPETPQVTSTPVSGNPESESSDNDALRALEIAKLQNFVKHGKHRKRAFESDVLTVAEIDHIIYAETVGETNGVGLWKNY